MFSSSSEQISNPDSVFLNPEFLHNLQQESESDFEPYDLLTYDAPLQNIDNFTMSDGKDGNLLVDAIMDYIQNPERSSWYRQNVLFKQNSMPEPFNEPSKELKIVLPLINLPF